MLNNEQYFVIEDYHKKSVFSSFLPGINGVKGIPVWSFYVNRGQCMTSFGSGNKDHSIMEFYPAHQAYQRTETMGFRTFLKIDGMVYEAFGIEDTKRNMYIGSNELVIEEINESLNLTIKVTYMTLPEEPLGGLIRKLEIVNTSNEKKSIELLDGMPELVPYGVELGTMKAMSQTAKAWMEVLDHEQNVPKFKVRMSMADTAEVSEVKGFHYGVGFCEGETLPVIVSKDHVFGYDTALRQPRHFMEVDLDTLAKEEQIAKNEVPCCFFMKNITLEPDTSATIHEIYGISKDEDALNLLVKRGGEKDYFYKKEAVVRNLTEDLTKRIATKTGNPVFDAYCKQSYLDNLLRGGYPIQIGKHIFYVYSRKHGDIERDYNFFVMEPEFYSQGNGNFRDVNQNRRCDVQFAPFVKDKNIKYFYNCVQLNGYNPLGIERSTYLLKNGLYSDMIEGSFTPGQLYEKVQRLDLEEEKKEELFITILDQAEENNETKFLEGYWTDHWTYNLDLVESYLSVYPEEEKQLLYGDRSYTYRAIEAHILPRSKRYVKTPRGIRQYHSIDESGKNSNHIDKKSAALKANLAEKLFLLSVVKTATLDVYGMGIEMEGGKPGWYDALNGLPGLFGSSMAETYELERNIEYLIQITEKYQASICIPEELYLLAEGILEEIIKHEKLWKEHDEVLAYWNEVNNKKEVYWKALENGVSGKEKELLADELLLLLKAYQEVVKRGIQKALTIGNGIAPTYFSYEVMEYKESEEGIIPLSFKLCKVPAFLEGCVRALKLEGTKEEKKQLYDKVKKSDLYDKKLSMYKVNTSLAKESFELGRAKAFTPGWLENESIWLHMEYKYLLELLKNGLYQEYEEDFYKAGVPFLDEQVYGRSLLENSSFIASSANPNKEIHGKGFVARLSGSTAEFLEMWQIMMFGKHPFVYGDELELVLEPMIPKYLIDESKEVRAKLLGQTDVIYHLPDEESLIPKEYTVSNYEICKEDGTVERVDKVRGKLAEEVRSGGFETIHVYLTR